MPIGAEAREDGAVEFGSRRLVVDCAEMPCGILICWTCKRGRVTGGPYLQTGVTLPDHGRLGAVPRVPYDEARDIVKHRQGKRIHDYLMLLDSVERSGLGRDQLADYLSIFRFGCPPHGGFAIGLERLTQKVLGLANVREASLFPRDRKRVRP